MGGRCRGPWRPLARLPAPVKALTPLQERFADEYPVDRNGTAAYIRAGGSRNGAAVGASRLLTQPNVLAKIAQVTAEHVSRLAAADAQAAQMLRTAKAEAEARAAELPEVEPVTVYVLRRLRENVERAMQAEPVRDKAGNPTGEYRYEGAVANAALVALGKTAGMFMDVLATKEVGSLADYLRELDEEDRLAGEAKGAISPVPYLTLLSSNTLDLSPPIVTPEPPSAA